MSPISESPSPNTIREQSQSPLQQQRSASHKQLHILQQQHYQMQMQQQQQQHIPQQPQRKSSSSSLNTSGKTGTTEQSCFNCATTNTPMWRRDLQGRSVCNACGVYFRVNGVNRVVKHGGTAVKRRVRVKEAPSSSSSSSSEIRRVSSVPDLKPTTTSASTNISHSFGGAGGGKGSGLIQRHGSGVSVSSSLGRSFEVAAPTTLEQSNGSSSGSGIAIGGSASDLSIDQNPQVGSLKRARFDV
ncbi:hypothetical protein BDR26DRAFT_859697 [Obelidium mucronatum]|nr:hypothetical protein BDR26DRAFT_859697 [Obelidium mucronatum]